jgi:hypothetical protein
MISKEINKNFISIFVFIFFLLVNKHPIGVVFLFWVMMLTTLILVPFIGFLLVATLLWLYSYIQRGKFRHKITGKRIPGFTVLSILYHKIFHGNIPFHVWVDQQMKNEDIWVNFLMHKMFVYVKNPKDAQMVIL